MPDSLSSNSDSAHTVYTRSVPNVALRSQCSHGYRMCRGEGGGGSTPTYMAQNDPHVALILLTTGVWGKIFWVNKTFSGQNLCSSVYSANIKKK